MPRRAARGTLRITASLAALALVTPLEADAQSSTLPRPPITPGPAAARSLLLPGWGQHTLGQSRAWAYAAGEAVLWALWANRRSLAGRARDGYRDLAWQEARAGTGARIDGKWAYYETMSEWIRSGAFDRDAQRAGVQPEEDESTFNGSMWRLARDLYFPGGQTPGEGDPAYEEALSYYTRRAYGTSYLWDWSGRDAALGRYKKLIHRSDDRFRQATTALGAVLANHLLSGVDAFVSAHARSDASLRVVPPTSDPLTGWRLVVRFTPGRFGTGR